MTVLTPTVLPLEEIDTEEAAGAKAFRLATMLRDGLNVPRAVVIPCVFFDGLLEKHGMRKRIDELLDATAVDSAENLEAASRQIEQWILTLELSREYERSLVHRIRPMLEKGPVAVRSSARGEDSDSAAFAGLLDSFLDRRTTTDVLAAVRSCWASCWSHRSLAYQNIRSLELSTMGVIIQEQVDAVVSGVLFTQNPTNEMDSEMILEYCSGTGERLVSGAITPHRIRLDRNAGKVIESTDGPDLAEIPDGFLEQIAETGRSVESVFGGAQDIEWCMDQQLRLCLLQTRPVTATVSAGATVLWSNANVNENYPHPISPLLFSIATRGYYHYFRNLAVAFGIRRRRISAMDKHLQQIVGTQSGRLYYNLTNIHTVLRAAPLGEFLASSFNHFVGAESTPPNENGHDWRTLSSNRLIGAVELAWIAWCAVGCFRGLEKKIRRFETRIDVFAERTRPDRLNQLSDNELRDAWQEFLSIRTNWTDASLADASSMISYQLTSSLLRRYTGSNDADENLVNRLLSGLSGIVSGLPAEKLWQLSRSARNSPELLGLLDQCPPDECWKVIQEDHRFAAFRNELNQFITDWGFRCSGELMLSQPCYQEQPSAILPIISSYASREGSAPHETAAARSSQREKETRDLLHELRSKPLLRWCPIPRVATLASRLLRWTQQSVTFRERARLKQALLYRRFRRLALQAGTRFTQRGLLKNPEQILFLTWEEIHDAMCGNYMLPGTMSSIAEDRFSEIEELRGQKPPDRIRLRPGDFWSRDKDTVDHVNSKHGDSGIGVCGGRIVGRAVVLEHPDQFAQVQEGDILVTCQTDPGWGPVLFLVKGLVMERGGMLSHGAILAREFGIPSVVGLADATQRFSTGDRILVDGDLGIVRVCDN